MKLDKKAGPWFLCISKRLNYDIFEVSVFSQMQFLIIIFILFQVKTSLNPYIMNAINIISFVYVQHAPALS